MGISLGIMVSLLYLCLTKNIIIMPNWCYNNITITGSEKGLNKIKRIVQSLESVEDKLFQSLIGLPEDTDMESYGNQGWYQTNVDWFGTKWDVGTEFVQEMTDTYIYMSGDTAWSPPINFCIQLSKRYGVEVEMYYEEPGSDFCGKTHIDSQGNYTEEDYSYQEGLYRFDGYDEWYDREWTGQIEWLIEQLGEQEFLDIQGIIRENFPFLTDSEVEECEGDLKKELSLTTGE